jgi:pyruvate/2-oxoglutarate dehydrogenase complex dihydrolipoamide dehydrogenase (E3) component
MTRPLTPDLCIIGAGSGGLSVAAGAAQMGAEIVLIERGLMGGDCLNFGCVPSKSLLAAARLAEIMRRSTALGIASTPAHVDFAAVMDSVHKVIAAIAPNDSVERFERFGVRVLRAEARFTDPRTVRAGDIEIRPRRFVIATGSHPAVPAIPGLDRAPYLTNETVFANRERPEHLVVIGGGPIGIEMAQAHRRLGARVTVLDIGPLLPRDDPELVAFLAQRLTSEGIAAHPRVEITNIEREGEAIVLRLADGGRITGSHLLVAAGVVVRVLQWPFVENDRAQTERDTEGLVKVVLQRNGRVLGASILGAAAGDLILPWALAISQKLKIGALADLIVPYPTRSEASKRAAGCYYTPTLFSPRTRRLVRFLARLG